MTTVGKCHNCEEGMLIIRKGKFGRFIACDKYPDCKTTFKLPSSGFLKVTNLKCEECGYPMVKIIRKGKKPQDVCINTNCPLKDVKVKVEAEGKTCPKCEKGKLVIRKSVYGSFLACDQYPKCRYTESLPENDNSEKKKPKNKKPENKKSENKS